MRQLDASVVKVWTVVGLLSSLPLYIPAIIVLIAADGHLVGWLLLALAVTVTVVAAGVVPRWRYAHTFWSLDEGILRVRLGIILRSEASVPVFRIQHVDLNQGPIDRWAGLQQLTIHTASPAADVQLPGIAADEAIALRSELLELAHDAIETYGLGETRDAV